MTESQHGSGIKRPPARTLPVARVLRGWRSGASGRRRAALAFVAVAVLAGLIAVGLPGGSPVAAAATCPAGGSLNVVAHTDDDVFFLNPDVQADVGAGKCVATVYVTASDGGNTSHMQNRELGVKAVYATMAGVANTWTNSVTTVAGKNVATATLAADPRIQLFFMRLPDGNRDGSGFPLTGNVSLQKLHQGQISSMTTLESPSQSYTKVQVVQVLGGLISSIGASTVRTLDNVHDYGAGDHSDHYTAGRLASEARTASAPSASLVSYLGYPSADNPANVSGDALTAKRNAFFAYAPYDSDMCQSVSACSTRSEGMWLERRYLADGSGASTPTTAPATTTSAGSSNLARTATVSASSENPGTGQTAVKAVDGVPDGYPGDYSREWATQDGKAGSWLQLGWSSPVTLDRVVLYDRPNTGDQITAGTLTFSDGSTVPVPALDDAGGAVTVTFAARTTSTVRLTVTGIKSSTSNIGLAEFEAWGR